MQNPGSQFLHDRNPQMHASDEVEAVVSYLRSGGASLYRTSLQIKSRLTWDF